MTSTVVEHATIEAKMVSAENLTVNMVREDRVAGPELDWYPKAFFRAMYIPDSLLDEWVASGDVREKLESMADVKTAEASGADR